jgi:hypothetical protein
MSRQQRAAHHRERARELKTAAQSQDLSRETRQAMLELADNYERLADLLEQLP